MKKFIFITCLLFIISGCSDTTSTHSIQKDSTLSGIHHITYDELEKKLDSDDIFVLYIGREDCRDCQEFQPILDEYLDKHQGSYLYYLDIKQYRDNAKKEDATKEEKEFYDHLYEELEINWTPTLKLIDHGEYVDNYTYLDEDYYQISDSKKQKEKKEKFINEFEEWMNKIYVEE